MQLLTLAVVSIPLSDWQFWGVVVAIFSVLVAIWLNERGIRRKRITYRVLIDKPINIIPKIVKNMGVIHGGRQLQDPMLAILKIETGTGPIYTRDYSVSLTFTFKGRKVVGYEVDNCKPPALAQIINNTTLQVDEQQKAIIFPKVDINPRNSLELQVVLSGPLDPGRGKAVKGDGYILNGSVREAPPRSRTFVLAGTGLVLVGVLVSMLFLQPAPQPQPLGVPCVAGNITISGSTALLSFIKPVAQNYQQSCKGAFIQINGTSSSVGIEDVHDDKAQIGASDVLAPAKYQLVDHPVVVTIFTLIVHQQGLENINNLTTEQIQKIFKGTYKNWSQLGGPDLPITVVGRISSSGTRQTLDNTLLKGGSDNLPVTLASDCLTVRDQQGFASGIHYCEQDSAARVVQRVQEIKGAIGYADLANATGSGSAGVKVLSVDQNQPQRGLVLRKVYPFWTVEHLYTKEKPQEGSLTAVFLNFILNSDFASRVATNLQYIPYSDYVRAGNSSPTSKNP